MRNESIKDSEHYSVVGSLKADAHEHFCSCDNNGIDRIDVFHCKWIWPCFVSNDDLEPHFKKIVVKC